MRSETQITGINSEIGFELLSKLTEKSYIKLFEGQVSHEGAVDPLCLSVVWR